MLSPATGRIGEGNARGSSAAPWTIISRQSPEVSGFGLTGSGIEHRSSGLVHEELARTFQVGNQGIEDGTQFEGGPANPIGKRGAVEVNALAAHDLRLPIERKMVGVFADQHMGDRSFRRQACLDQPSRGRGLDDAVGAGAARIFGATGDDDAELRRDHIQPLRHIFTDAMQASPAGADQACRLDHLFDTRKMAWKRTPIGCARSGETFACRSVGLVLSLDGCDGRFQILQGQIELIGIGLLGFTPERRLPEGGDQSFQPFDPLVLAAFTRGCRDQHRLQSGYIIGKIGGVQHVLKLPDLVPSCLWNWPPESSCRSYSMASGALVSTARTRRQSRPANSASNWAWPNVIRPSLMPGQVKLCSSRRL